MNHLMKTRWVTIAAIIVVISIQAQAATVPLQRNECKQIGVPATISDGFVDELVKGISGKIIEYYNWAFRPKTVGESRTFGRPMRKLQSLLLPVVFAMGIVFMMMKIILFLSLKSVAIGLMILAINFAFIASKVAIFFKGYGSHGYSSHGYSAGGGGGIAGGPQKDVHVHVHPTTGYGKAALGGWSDRSGYKGSYYMSGEANTPFRAWIPATLEPEKQAGEGDVLKKRSASEIELPHQMGVSPPIPDAQAMARIKSRRSLTI